MSYEFLTSVYSEHGKAPFSQAKTLLQEWRLEGAGGGGGGDLRMSTKRNLKLDINLLLVLPKIGC